MLQTTQQKVEIAKFTSSEAHLKLLRYWVPKTVDIYPTDCIALHTVVLEKYIQFLLKVS